MFKLFKFRNCNNCYYQRNKELFINQNICDVTDTLLNFNIMTSLYFSNTDIRPCVHHVFCKEKASLKEKIINWLVETIKKNRELLETFDHEEN